ncbi:hypothetical protein ACP26L_35925 (plasmid) [Paenibacillus sp. S-38]|uniref:hypothetical protein n=1 Tax=Paenibacillus sp. S-38 TaxID=3416710 RepID=UPI003CEAED68
MINTQVKNVSVPKFDLAEFKETQAYLVCRKNTTPAVSLLSKATEDKLTFFYLMRFSSFQTEELVVLPQDVVSKHVTIIPLLTQCQVLPDCTAALDAFIRLYATKRLWENHSPEELENIITALLGDKAIRSNLKLLLQSGIDRHTCS